MDGHAGNFEDQFRRMVVSNGGPPPQGFDGAPPPQPTVRLPPASSYPVTRPQQYQQPPAPGFGPSAPAPSGYASGPQPQYAQQTQYGPPPQHMQQSRQHHAPRGNHFGQPHTFGYNRGGFYGPPPQRVNNVQHAQGQGQRSRHQQQVAIDPNAFQRGGYPNQRGRGGQNHLFNPHQQFPSPVATFGDSHQRKVNYLAGLALSEVTSVQMTQEERDEKLAFCQALQKVCDDVCDADPDRLPRVSLECFGSFKSGFATAGSDMDLVIVVKDQSSTSASLSLLEDDLPRALERMLLKLGFGARLLTRTRVPIIKVCEKPGSSLLSKLRAEREKWDLLPNELKYPHLHPEGEDEAGEGAAEEPSTPSAIKEVAQENGASLPKASPPQTEPDHEVSTKPMSNGNTASSTNGTRSDSAPNEAQPANTPSTENAELPKPDNLRPKRVERPWVRERKAGPLDFPKDGIGIQSDINFFNPLGLHNTQLLYCYSLCDDRVQPMVLFVKAWAKRRKINSSYSGTLSSYGFVLMVLHYLVNVASPPVLPNLQGPSPRGKTSPPEPGVDVDGWHVNFWRSDEEIKAAKQRGHLSSNRESLGSLLAGFFQYYSSQGGGPQFIWTAQVLSLRTERGILSKTEKGWTKAHTEEGEGKKIQHRFLFCIEDPFELDHNVARTVTHNGIVAIRDEFRRARRILMAVGRGEGPTYDGQLFDELIEPEYIESIAADVKAEGWQPDLDGANDKAATPAPARGGQPGQPRGPQPARSYPSRKQGVQSPATTNAHALNVADNNAFPTLGSAKPKKTSLSHKRAPSEGEFSEITGEKAKAVLDEVKRKKDEAQAESTAMGAAQAVLDGE